MKFTDLYTQSAEFFNNLDTSGIIVREVRTPEDQKKAQQLRNRGYRMYFGADPASSDDEKMKPNETTYLAVDKLDNPLGTIRVLDRRKGEIELDHFLDVDALL